LDRLTFIGWRGGEGCCWCGKDNEGVNAALCPFKASINLKKRNK